MQGLGKHRLWTLVAVAPIIVLCGVLLYAYVIRPRMQGPASGAPGRTPAEERWIGEARKVGPSLLDLLSPQQQHEVQTAQAKYVADVKDLPPALRKQVERVVRVLPNTGGARARSGTINYEPSGAPGEPTEISIRGDFNLEGKRGQPGPGVSFTIPTSPGPLGRKPLEPRPEIMKRTAIVFLAQNITAEEFQPLWDSAIGKVAPLAGALTERPEGGGIAQRGEKDLAPADRATVLAYADDVVAALPKPSRAQALAFKDPRDVNCHAYQMQFAPEAPPSSVGVGGIFSLPQGVPPAGRLEYHCDAPRGAIMIRWDPEAKGIRFSVLTMRF
jgi:hypothetical protein